MAQFDPLLQSHRNATHGAVAAFALVQLLATYLTQRALRDIHAVSPSFWSQGAQFGMLGLQFSYVTLTLAWPIVLGLLCFAFRHFVRKKLLLKSFVTTEVSASPQWSGDNLLGRDLVAPAAQFVWHVMSLFPALATGLHIFAAISSLLVLRSNLANDWIRHTWTIEQALFAAGMLVLCCAFAFWSTGLFFVSMTKLRHALMEPPILQKANGASSESKRVTASLNTPLNSPQQTRQMLGKWLVFISAKKLDQNGQVTRDSQIANELYDFLISRGLSVFLSSRSLELLGASAYKTAIDGALDQCRVLVAVGTSAQNLNSDWVRYEWDSFFNDILSGVKPDGRVFAYLDGVPISELPRPLRQAQVFPRGSDEMERLYNFIQNALRD